MTSVSLWVCDAGAGDWVGGRGVEKQEEQRIPMRITWIKAVMLLDEKYTTHSLMFLVAELIRILCSDL